MSKSTITFVKTAKGYEVRQGGKAFFRTTVRKDARRVLREARAADRAAVAFLQAA